MPREKRTHCDVCGRTVEKLTRMEDGIGYCASCYSRAFVSAPCEQCGKSFRTLPSKNEKICRKCRNKDRKCVRCGKPTPRASLTVENGVACGSCAPYFKEPKPCPLCGQLSLFIARDSNLGFDEPACEKCRVKGHINCPTCGKNRRPGGKDDQGRMLCKHCYESGGKPFVCPRCGKEGLPHSAERCRNCYNIDVAKTKAKRATEAFTQPWVRESFNAYVEELLERLGGERTKWRIERHALFFAKLDAAGAKPGAIDSAFLGRLFGLEGLRRFATPYGFLVKTGAIPEEAEADRRETAELSKQAAIMAATEGAWYQSTLQRFHDYLHSLGARYKDRGWKGEQDRFSSRTITLAMRAAKAWLVFVDETADINDVRQIDPAHLNGFLLRKPGWRSSLGRFVKFLNQEEKLFRKLSVPHVRQEIRKDTFLSREQYEELLARWLDDPPDETVKESLTCSLMLLYAQTAQKISRLRLEDVQGTEDGAYRVLFGRTELTLHPRVSKLLERYLRQRQAVSKVDDADANPYLFPGRTATDHITPEAIAYYLKKADVKSDQLFATAIFYAYLSGLKHPKVLVNAFGIASKTAIKYLNLIDPRLVDEVNAKHVRG